MQCTRIVNDSCLKLIACLIEDGQPGRSPTLILQKNLSLILQQAMRRPHAVAPEFGGPGRRARWF
jgi:hypothetical protein